MAPPVEYNFKAPVPRAQGGIRIEPNFPVAGPINKAMAIARNSEVPDLLRAAGELTPEEEISCQYHKLKSREDIYVGKEGNDVWNGTYLTEKDVFGMPTAGENMIELRKRILKRGEGVFSNHSAFEGILAGRDFTKDKRKVRRSYPLGMTVNPDATKCGPAETNTKMLENQQKVAKVTNLIAKKAVEFLEHSAPKELLEMMANRADTDVPMTFGSVENKYFTTAQLNFSDGDEVSLELTLGEAGALHVDNQDDARRWTVLISLSHNPPGYWPGRTMITALRVYAIIAPFTVLIFKAVNPHISLGPIKMGSSIRAPYIPTIPSVPYVHPKIYVFARLMIVNYPKRSIIDESPSLARTTTASLLRGEDGLDCTSPQSLSSALMAFGTQRNQWEYLAMADAFNKMRLAKMNPNYVLPTATEIANLHRWRESDDVNILE